MSVKRFGSFPSPSLFVFSSSRRPTTKQRQRTQTKREFQPNKLNQCKKANKLISSMSRLIPVLRGGQRVRSASPNVTLPTVTPAVVRPLPLRAASPLAAFLDNRTYATAGLSGSNHGNAAVTNWQKRPSLIRSFSDVAVPEPPTSNHPHKPLPGAKGQLIYTET